MHNLIRRVTKERRDTNLSAESSKTDATFVEMILVEDAAYSWFDRREKECMHGQSVGKRHGHSCIWRMHCI